MSFYTELTGIKEGSVYQVNGIFKDEAGVAIPAADLTSVKIWLKNQEDNAVINLVSGQDVLNTDRGTVDASGNLVLTLTPADNAMVGTGAFERHILTIESKWNAGASVSYDEIHLVVSNFTHVPTS